MKTLSLKEQLKDNLRALQVEDIREYHITHDFYSNRRLTSNFEVTENQKDYSILVEQLDLDCINELLYPKPKIGNIFADALSGLATPSNEKMTLATPIEKPSVDLLHRVEDFYVNYLEDGLLNILPKQSGRLTQANIALIQKEYPINTVIVKNICILSEFWIRDPLEWKANGEVNLLAHLFVEYEVPSCLKKCWYSTATIDNLQWLIAYVLYAQGGSVKQMAAVFNWQVINKKLWHELFQAPAHLSPDEAVLYCELKRINASDKIYQSITANPAYVINLLSHPNQKTLEFWFSMVRWLVQNEERIIGTEMARILVWARHQFTEFEKTGKQFTMNARSCFKVQRETLEYFQAIVARQRELARQREIARQAAIERQEEAEARAEEARLQSMKQDNYPHYHWQKIGLSWTVEDENFDQWKFVELSSSEELIEEGFRMDNCVGGYDDVCAEGFSAIISLRHNDTREVTIEIDPESRMLVQASAYANQDISVKHNQLIERWLNKCVSKENLIKSIGI